MLILAMETTADLCSVALCNDAGIIAERAFRHRMHLSERLLEDAQAVLKDAEVGLVDVDAFAVGIGPGSFTGVRIGVTVMKTLADVLAKPVCGVGSLEAIAASIVCGSGRVVVPIIRARPGSVYAAFYRPGPPLLEIRPPGQYSLEELAEAAAGPDSYSYCGEGLATVGEALRALAGPSATFGPEDPPRAEMVARIARTRLAEGPPESAIALSPLYIAQPPIDPRAERKGRP